MDHVNIRRLDGTLLLVFRGLMRRKKTVLVAADLGLTQSAVSHALGRLRDIFGDPLFLRRPHGLEPTAAAEALLPRVESVLDGLDGLLGTRPEFDPARAETTLRIAALDLDLAMIGPVLARLLAAEAPGMRLAALALGRGEAMAALEERRADIAFGFVWAPGERVLEEALFTESYLVAGRRDNPVLAEPLTPESYAAADHLVVSPAGDFSGIVDQALEAAGLTRRVAMALPLFLPAVSAIAETSLVATLPARLVRANAARFDLAWQVPPVPIRPYTVSAFRHRRDAGNPLHDWVLAGLRGLADLGSAGT